jgi:hypothetical protein
MLNSLWSAFEMVHGIIPQQEMHHNGRFWTIEEHRLIFFHYHYKMHQFVLF